VARQELLERAKTEKVCGTYYKDLDGKLVTADSEESLASKVGALRLAAIASGAVAIASCADKTEQREPVRPIGSEHRQLWGYICPPETNHKDAKLPITGPREPPQPNGILDELGEKQTSSENE
jgi:hypothetical protein